MTGPAALEAALRSDGFTDPVPAVGQTWELPLEYLPPGARHLARITSIGKTVSGWQCRVLAWRRDGRGDREQHEGILHVRRLVDEYVPVWCPVPHPDGDPTLPCVKLIEQGWTQEEGHGGGHMWMDERTAAILRGGHYDATAAVSGQPFGGHPVDECPGGTCEFVKEYPWLRR